jgi:hypothetical protein
MAEECVDCGCADQSSPVKPPCSEAAPCVGAEVCSKITPAGCVAYTDPDIECGDDTVVPTTTRLNSALQLIVAYFCTRLSGLFVELTYAEAETLATGADVVPGTQYFITDRNILLTGISPTNFSDHGYRVMSIVKNSYYTAGGTHLGVWHIGLAPAVGNTVIWGGKVWVNISGSVGTRVDVETLSGADWEVTLESAYYEDKAFEINYDFANDWVAIQKDNRGNCLGVSYYTATFTGMAYNPCSVSDWGNNTVIDNQCWGVVNNRGGIVAWNKNMGVVNENVGDVTLNQNSGAIDLNLCPVNRNSNSGYIRQNVCQSVEFNRNVGDIFDNENTGVIEYNTNTGSILNIGNTTTDINYNNNNGVINTTVVGPITGTVVNL